MNFRYHHHSSSSLLTLYAPATIYIYTYNVAAVDNTYRWTTTWDVRVGNIVGGDNMYMTTICTVRIALHEIAYEARLCDKHTNYIHKTIKKILKQQHLWGDNMCSEVRHILSPTTICTERQYVPSQEQIRYLLLYKKLLRAFLLYIEFIHWRISNWYTLFNCTSWAQTYK